MVHYLESKTGVAVQIRDVGFTTIFNTLTNVVFSRDLMGFEEDDVGFCFNFKEHYRKIAKLGLVPNLADFYPILSGLDLQGLKRKIAECNRRVDVVYEGFIAQRRRDRDRNGGERLGDFLDSMLDIGFCDEQIKNSFQQAQTLHLQLWNGPWQS